MIKQQLFNQLSKFKTKSFIMKAIFFILCLAIILGAWNRVNQLMGLKDDNIVEEVIEHQIKHHTGIDLDFSVDSPE